jgi:hypothetical protein
MLNTKWYSSNVRITLEKIERDNFLLVKAKFKIKCFVFSTRIILRSIPIVERMYKYKE